MPYADFPAAASELAGSSWVPVPGCSAFLGVCMAIAYIFAILAFRRIVVVWGFLFLCGVARPHFLKFKLKTVL